MNTETGLTTQQKAISVGRRGVQLASFEDAWRFSQAVVQSGLAPYSFKTAQQVLIAIQCGAEVGFAPMQSLQSFAVINGRPCLWGDAVPALVHSSGECEYIKEWFEGEGDERKAVCETKRKGQSEPCRKSFSVADAKKAGLWQTKARVTRRNRNGETYETDNDSPWWKYPERMLAMRARSWCLRDAFADALRGIQIREEVEDYADSTVPGEVIEPTPVRRLSEIRDESPAAVKAAEEPEAARQPEQPIASGMSLRNLRNVLKDAESYEQVDSIVAESRNSLRVGKITEEEAGEFYEEANDRKAAIDEASAPAESIPHDEAVF